MPLVLLLLLCLLPLSPRAGAGESGITIERGDPMPNAADRTRLARSIYRHDFENVRDPDTGLLLPQSASLNAELWPDFWEPVRAVGFPEYLIPTISIVEDRSGAVPGNYRDWPNHALRIDYDGTRVGIRTRTPVPVDPSLAYEYSVVVRDENLEGARIRTGVDWLRIDPSASNVLRSDEIPGLETGQTDWPVLPAQMLVNDPPPEANAARLFVIVDRDPASVGGAYHGTLWLDNAALKPLPKIRIDAPARDETTNTRVIPVRYAGLFDNVPDPDNPGYFRGKRYTRQVEITDVFGQPVASSPVASGERRAVEADDEGVAVEGIPFPNDRFGVYYFNIRLYDADDNLATDVMRAVAVMRPARQRDSMSLQSSKPVFGVTSGVAPRSVLRSTGFLRDILQRSGVKTTKLSPWDDAYAEPGGNVDYYASLTEEIRNIRSAGLSVQGMIRPPAGMFGDSTLAAAVTSRPEQFEAILAEAGQQLGLFVDGWQWGDDEDDSLDSVPAGPALEAADAALREFAGGMPVANNVLLGGAPRPAFPLRRTVAQAFFPENDAGTRLWPLAAPVYPWLYEQFFVPRGLTYPPPRLSALAPRPAQDALEEAARARDRTGSWLFLESRSGNIHEPNAPAERKQLEDLLVRAVYAVALSPDVVFLGNLFDPAKGLLRRDIMGTNTLETMARPSFLAASTLSELFEGVEYLGEIWLLPPFEAHVFRRPGTDESVIALWHNDSRDIVNLARREIAEGPLLRLTDWAGNSEQMGPQIPVRRVPTFITGLSANLALTRMSMRINPELPMLARTLRQNQMVEVVNHIPRQTPALLRLRYAARLPGGAMENGWTVRPEEMRFNLLPFSPQLQPGRFRYGVSPDPNSQIQLAGPLGSDKAALKIAQASVSFNTSPPADIMVYLPFRLQSELEVDVERLVRQNDPNFVTLQMKIRWFPMQAGARRTEIKLTPYYMKRGQMREAAPFPVTVKATPLDQRGQDTAFEAVELRIPRRPPAQTWIGLEEESGSSYYIVDVTDYLTAE